MITTLNLLYVKSRRRLHNRERVRLVSLPSQPELVYLTLSLFNVRHILFVVVVSNLRHWNNNNLKGSPLQFFKVRRSLIFKAEE